jgi:5'(3')-deoxyribonucleotidase
MRLIFDMDNTLADFDGSGGVECMEEEGFFRNLDPYDNVVDTMEILFAGRFDIYILSACIDTPHCVREKKEWLAKYLPFISDQKIILIPYGTNKAQAFQTLTGKPIMQTDVLFDDYKVNLLAWIEAGGTAIKCGKIYKKDRKYRQVIQFTGVDDILATL